MAGYSQNPLVIELGIMEGDQALLLNVPEHYDELI